METITFDIENFYPEYSDEIVAVLKCTRESTQPYRDGYFKIGKYYPVIKSLEEQCYDDYDEDEIPEEQEYDTIFRLLHSKHSQDDFAFDKFGDFIDGYEEGGLEYVTKKYWKSQEEQGRNHYMFEIMENIEVDGSTVIIKPKYTVELI